MKALQDQIVWVSVRIASSFRRMLKFKALNAPEIFIENEKRILDKAVKLHDKLMTEFEKDELFE